MKKTPKDEQYSEEQTVARRDAVIKLMLNKPPEPHSAMKIGKRKAKDGAKACLGTGVPSGADKSKRRSK